MATSCVQRTTGIFWEILLAFDFLIYLELLTREIFTLTHCSQTVAERFTLLTDNGNHATDYLETV